MAAGLGALAPLGWADNRSRRADRFRTTRRYPRAELL